MVVVLSSGCNSFSHFLKCFCRFDHNRKREARDEWRGVLFRADWYADLRGPFLGGFPTSEPHCFVFTCGLFPSSRLECWHRLRMRNSERHQGLALAPGFWELFPSPRYYGYSSCFGLVLWVGVVCSGVDRFFHLMTHYTTKIDG